MRHANVRNVDEVEVREMIKGRHNMRLRQLGKPAGSIALGATLTEVAPGGISFPRHAHYVNEEAIYILSGSGEARIGDSRVPVRPRDWIALRTGPEHAHQMANVSATEPLVYLCISTMRGAEMLSIPVPAKSALASPIRQARSASAASACFGPAAARSITGTASPRRAEFGPSRSFARRQREHDVARQARSPRSIARAAVCLAWPRLSKLGRCQRSSPRSRPSEPGLHRSAFPRLANDIGRQRQGYVLARECQREGCNVNASIYRYIPRIPGDIRLCHREDARRERLALSSRPRPSPQANEETPANNSPLSAGGLFTSGGSPVYDSERVDRPRAGFEPAADACGGMPDPCYSSLRTTGMRLFGKAAWYNLVGRQTANGEILDTVTATAAHRSLPLASYAKVTDIDNGRSVVVKINDRGPYSRGRILDLSPCAADALDIKRVGVVAVVVEPLVNRAGPTFATFQPSSTAVSQ
jgi:rare lipoprotein A